MQTNFVSARASHLLRLLEKGLPLLTAVSLFGFSPSLSQQVLKLELKEIREQQDLLFRFMNFLKQEGAVHVLQFCLAVGTCVPSLSDVCKRHFSCFLPA